MSRTAQNTAHFCNAAMPGATRNRIDSLKDSAQPGYLLVVPDLGAAWLVSSRAPELAQNSGVAG